jgi:hypothetical protein
MKYFICFIVLFSFISKANAQRINANEASKYINQTRNVRGQVYDIRTIRHSKTTLVYLGGPFPKHQFTIFVKDNTKGLNFVKNYSNIMSEYARVYGKIIIYRGKPAVALADWSMVRTLDFKDESPKNYHQIRYELRDKKPLIVDKEY